MYKPFIIFICLAVINTSFAGGITSIPVKEEVDKSKRNSSHSSDLENSLEVADMNGIAVGAAILIAGGILAREVYKSYSSPSSSTLDAPAFKSPSYLNSNLDASKNTSYQPIESYKTYTDSSNLKVKSSLITSQTALEPSFKTAKYQYDSDADSEEDSDTDDEVEYLRNKIGSDQSIIDLSCYNNVRKESPKIDLHPVYNNNPRKHLRQEIFEYQKKYHKRLLKDNRVHIITGTGIKRPGPNYILQNNVGRWLQEDYFQRRIKYIISKKGLYTVLLRRNIN